MTPVTCMAGHRLALFGLGGSGLATALALKAGGAEVVAWDDSPAGRDKATAEGIAVADLRDADWSGFAALVLAPGVPLTHPVPHWTVDLAHAAGIEIIGDIELFCRERAAIAPEIVVFGGVTITRGDTRARSPAALVVITGTNGKSTTTALIAHILQSAGRDVQMGGNIGTAILSLEPPSPGRVHVIEMSSFQIDLTPSLNPTVGVLLNISPDHLDRHDTMDKYAAIKERVVSNALNAVVGFDDDWCRDICGRLLAGDNWVYPISGENSLGGAVFLEQGRLWRLVTTVKRDSLITECLADLRAAQSLRGTHNGQNAAAAFSVCEALGVPHDAIGMGLRTFPGLAHRMEQVARLRRVLFVNDSKATNADSAEKALASFPDGIFWILGGKPKEGGIEALKPFFTKIAKAYLIGEASEAFAATLDGHVVHERCDTLDRAVAAAAADAARSDAKEPVVLLSPACASYDQYRNFEIRGDHFRDLVRALPGVEMRS